MTLTDRDKGEAATRGEHPTLAPRSDADGRYRALLAKLPVGVLIHGPDAEILVSNAKALELLGLSEDQLLGRTSFDPTWNVLREDGSPFPGPSHPVPTAIATRRAVRDVVMAVHRPLKGDRVWLLVDAEPELNADGSVSQVVCTFSDITAHKAAESALVESTAFLNAIVDSTSDLIWSFDATFRLRTFNRAYAEHFWETRSLRVEPGMLPEQLLPPPFAEAWRGWYRRALEDGPYEMEYVTHDGSRTLELTFNVVRRGDAVSAVSVFGRDVSARKRAEDELRTLSRAVEQSPTSIVITDPAGNIEYVNPHFERVTGYSRAEAIGHNPRMLQSGATAPEVYAELWRVIAEGGEWRGELCNRRKNGETFWEAANISGIKDESGRIVHYVAVKAEITARKLVEAALRESEERYKRMFESAPIAVSITRGTEITYANPAYLRMYQVSSLDELRRIAPLALVAPEWRDRILENVRRRAEGLPVPDAYEIEGLRRDGTRMPVLMYLTRASFPDGPGTLTFTLDITDRKRAEQERSTLEAQFHQAQKMESVGRLAGGVAHDFNNMLGVILGNVEVALHRAPPTDPLYDELEEIRQAALRSAALTRQLLAFARKQTVSPKVLDLNETVAGMSKMLKRLIGENVRLERRAEEPLWPVRVDPSQIDQILANLCVNARDAIAGIGEVTIETANATLDAAQCEARAELVPGEYVRLTVRDDGAGMDAATRARIFEPFFTTKPSGTGTGLGLATVYGIVKQNAGLIDVQSAPGAGTTFSIYLPRHVSEAEREAPTSAPSIGGHEVILLVEDEPGLLRATKSMLEGAGYQVLAAATPAVALRLAREHRGALHLLLTDVVMPDMNGRDLAERLVALRPGLARLFMSGYTPDVIAKEGVLDDGIAFIQKPFSRQSLVDMVRRVLDAEPAR